MKNVTSDKRNLWMFPLGTVGRDMIYNLFTNFIFTYILFTRHLTAAQLGAVTAIMVGARVFDALNDPVMGNIIERTRSRYGKFKPWLVIGILSTSVVVYLAFNTSLQGWSFIAFFGVIYFLYSITYTMHDISYWGMVSALSSDPHVRDLLTSRTNLFAGIGGVIASILIPMLTTGSGTLGGSTATAYGRVALVICILAPLFLCATIFGVRERRDYHTKEVPPVSFKKIWNTITGNPQILWISLVFLLQQIGNDVVMGGLGSTYVYFAFGYEGGLYSLFNTVGLAATALLMIFYPMLAKRFRRKHMMDKLMLLSVIGYAVMIVAGLALSGGMVKFWILTAGYMVANLGQYGFYLIMMISLINTVEYNEYLRGERDEAIITSLRPFFTKLASAIVVAVTSATYLIFGVTGYTNRISALERGDPVGVARDAEDEIRRGRDRHDDRGGELCEERAQGGDDRLVALAAEVFVILHGVDERDHHNEIEPVLTEVCDHVARGEDPELHHAAGKRQPGDDHNGVADDREQHELIHHMLAAEALGEHRIEDHKKRGRRETDGVEERIQPALIPEGEVHIR